MCSIVEFSVGDFEKITLEITCVPGLRITDALCLVQGGHSLPWLAVIPELVIASLPQEW